MFCILSLNMELTTLAPQYANFGSQVYFNSTTSTIQPCSMAAPPDNCTMTQIGNMKDSIKRINLLGTFVNQISVRTSFFGVIYYYATWIFILFFFIGMIIAVFKSKASNIEARDSDSESDED